MPFEYIGIGQKSVFSSENTFGLSPPALIVATYKAVDDFTVVVSYDQIKEKNYSLSAGQYFDVKIEYNDITPREFEKKMTGFKSNLDTLFGESKDLEKEIKKQLAGLKYE
jgi:type I restriction enzyme M protein